MINVQGRAGLVFKLLREEIEELEIGLKIADCDVRGRKNNAQRLIRRARLCLVEMVTISIAGWSRGGGGLGGVDGRGGRAEG